MFTQRDEIVIRRKTGCEKTVEAFYNATNDIVTGRTPEIAVEFLKTKFGCKKGVKITKLNHGENW